MKYYNKTFITQSYYVFGVIYLRCFTTQSKQGRGKINFIKENILHPLERHFNLISVQQHNTTWT